MLNIANISQELKIWYEGLVLLLRAGNYDYSSNFNKNKTFLPRHGSSEPDSHRIPPRSVHNTQVQHKPKANLYEVRTQSTLSPQNGEQTRSIVVSNPQPYTNSSGSHRTRTVQLYNQTNMTYPALTLDQLASLQYRQTKKPTKQGVCYCPRWSDALDLLNLGNPTTISKDKSRPTTELNNHFPYFFITVRSKHDAPNSRPLW
jgi:hypothetical protein